MTDKTLPAGRIEHISGAADFETLMDGTVVNLSDHELRELRREYADLNARHADMLERYAKLKLTIDAVCKLLSVKIHLWQYDRRDAEVIKMLREADKGNSDDY